MLPIINAGAVTCIGCGHLFGDVVSTRVRVVAAEYHGSRTSEYCGGGWTVCSACRGTGSFCQRCGFALTYVDTPTFDGQWETLDDNGNTYPFSVGTLREMIRQGRSFKNTCFMSNGYAYESAAGRMLGHAAEPCLSCNGEGAVDGCNCPEFEPVDVVAFEAYLEEVRS